MQVMAERNGPNNDSNRDTEEANGVCEISKVPKILIAMAF